MPERLTAARQMLTDHMAADDTQVRCCPHRPKDAEPASLCSAASQGTSAVWSTTAQQDPDRLGKCSSFQVHACLSSVFPAVRTVCFAMTGKPRPQHMIKHIDQLEGHVAPYAQSQWLEAPPCCLPHYGHIMTNPGCWPRLLQVSAWRQWARWHRQLPMPARKLPWQLPPSLMQLQPGYESSQPGALCHL